MAGGFRGCCPDCGHEWEAVELSFSCGSIKYLEPETYRTYFCSRCFVHLYVPRDLDRNTWLRWLTGSAREIAECPLLKRAHERIARILAEARSGYVPVSVDIGTILCPDCSEPMALGEYRQQSD